MRGSDLVSGSLFSYVDLDERIPSHHPLRKIRQIVNDALSSMDADFDRLYAGEGRPSIPPECLLRASLIQILYSIRSERQLMEQSKRLADGVRPEVPRPPAQILASLERCGLRSGRANGAGRRCSSWPSEEALPG